jgi:hypothetical protein
MMVQANKEKGEPHDGETPREYMPTANTLGLHVALQVIFIETSGER